MQLTDEIDRRAGLSRGIRARVPRPPRPVVLTDAISHWRALGRWSPQFFKQEYGHLEVEVDGETMSLGRPDRPRRGVDGREPCSVPAQSAPVRLAAGASSPTCLPMPDCTQPNWLESRFFPSRDSWHRSRCTSEVQGAQFPVLHWDGLHTHAFLMQLYGDKEYIVFSPDQTLFCSRDGVDSNLSIVDPLDPDLEKFPLSDHARACASSSIRARRSSSPLAGGTPRGSSSVGDRLDQRGQSGEQRRFPARLLPILGTAIAGTQFHRSGSVDHRTRHAPLRIQVIQDGAIRP